MDVADPNYLYPDGVWSPRQSTICARRPVLASISVYHIKWASQITHPHLAINALWWSTFFWAFGIECGQGFLDLSMGRWLLILSCLDGGMLLNNDPDPFAHTHALSVNWSTLKWSRVLSTWNLKHAVTTIEAFLVWYFERNCSPNSWSKFHCQRKEKCDHTAVPTVMMFLAKFISIILPRHNHLHKVVFR